MLESFLLLVIGAVFGVIFAVLLEEPLSRLWQTGKTKTWRSLSKLLRQGAVVLPQPHEFRIGRITARCVVVDGTGGEEFSSEHITCHYDPEPLTLPDDLAAIKDEIAREQDKAREAGQKYHWNGPWYALENYTRGRTLYEEDLILDLWFRPTDYYSFLATSMSLDRYVTDDYGNRLTVREKYLKETNWDSVIPFLATSLGISVATITSDELLVIAERSSKVGAWEGHFNASVNEALSRVADRDEKGNPNPCKAAARGATEELNIDLRPSDIRFLTFGFETIHYQWVLLGMARVNFTAAQIQERRTTGAKDKWENKTLHYIPFNVQAVVDFVLNHSPWTPFGLVCVLHTLIHEFGRSDVERALA